MSTNPRAGSMPSHGGVPRYAMHDLNLIQQAARALPVAGRQKKDKMRNEMLPSELSGHHPLVSRQRAFLCCQLILTACTCIIFKWWSIPFLIIVALSQVLLAVAVYRAFRAVLTDYRHTREQKSLLSLNSGSLNHTDEVFINVQPGNQSPIGELHDNQLVHPRQHQDNNNNNNNNTEQQLQSLTKSNELKGKFIRKFSHDIRVPFSVVQNTLAHWKTIVDSQNPDAVMQTMREALPYMIDESTSISRILNRVLMMQKSEDGFESLIIEPFNMEVMLARLCEAYRQAGQEKQLHIHLNVQSVLDKVVSLHWPRLQPPLGVPYHMDLHGSTVLSTTTTSTTTTASTSSHQPFPFFNTTLLRCDGHQIKGVISNLVGNAAKFCKAEGRIDVLLKYEDFHRKIEVGNEISGKPYNTIGTVNVIVEVKDNGPGIPSDGSAQLFKMYQQMDPSHRSFSSSGLGLYISKNIVEAHGGEITCESMLGHGATFTVCIPMQVELVRTSKKQTHEATCQQSLLSARTLSSSVETPSYRTIASSRACDIPHTNPHSQMPVCHEEATPGLQTTSMPITPLHLYARLRDRPLIDPTQMELPPAISMEKNASVPQENKSVQYTDPLPKLPGSTISPVQGSRQQVNAKQSGNITKKPAVLFVDDCKTTCKLWKQILYHHGYDVTTVDDGDVAVQACLPHPDGQSRKFAAIVMDFSMHRMDGATAAIHIRRAGIHTPIVGVTANALQVDVDKMLQSGMDNVFIKGSETLKPDLLQWLQKHVP